MRTNDTVILMGAVCGLALTLGGLLLLLRGAINLTRQAGGGPGSGLSFEFKGTKLSTDFPAIAIFAIGLLFFGLTMWSESLQTRTIKFVGRLEDVPPQQAIVYAAVPLMPVISSPDGSIEYSLNLDPNNDTVFAVVVTPGREPVMNVTSTQLRPTWFGAFETARFDKPLPVGRAVSTMPPASTIEAARAPLPGLDEPTGWKK